MLIELGQEAIEAEPSLKVVTFESANPDFFLAHYGEQAIRHYIKINNNDPKPFVWSKTADDILASVEDFVYELLTHDTRVLSRVAWQYS